MIRTTIMLPTELKTLAARRAGELGISLGELIRESLEMKLSQAKSQDHEDSFLADEAVFAGPAPNDLAKEHDRYLYGDES